MDVSFYNTYESRHTGKIIIGDEYTNATDCVSDLEHYPMHIYLYTVKLTHSVTGAKVEDIDLDPIKDGLAEATANNAQYNKDVRREYIGGVL